MPTPSDAPAALRFRASPFRSRALALAAGVVALSLVAGGIFATFTRAGLVTMTASLIV